MTIEDSPLLFINITILDASEAAKAKVAKKMENAILPSGFKEKVATDAGKCVKLSKVAGKLGHKFCKKLPIWLEEKGVTVEMEYVFHDGPYVVLQLQVKEVDIKAMEKAKRNSGMINYPEMPAIDGDDDDDEEGGGLASAIVQWSLKMVGAKNQERLEKEILPKKVQNLIEVKLVEVLGDKMERKQMKAEVQVFKEEFEARYFFAKLKEIRLAEAAATEQKGSNLLKGLFRGGSGGEDEYSSDSSEDEFGRR